MAIAGKKSRVKIPGTGIAMGSPEACTQIGTSDNYKITDRSKILWDREETVSVFENGSPATTGYTVDYLTGVIKFSSTPTTPVTVQATYRPSSFITWAKTFSFSASTDMLDTTNFKSTAVDSFRREIEGLSEVTGTVGGFHDATDNLSDLLLSGDNLILIWIPNKDGSSVYYIEAKIESEDINTDVESLVMDDLNFSSIYALEKEPA